MKTQSIIIAIIAIMLTGCAGLSNRQSDKSVDAAQGIATKQSAEWAASARVPAIRVTSPDGTQMEIPGGDVSGGAESASDASSQFAGMSSWINKIPIGLSLILLAVGIIGVVAAIKYLKASSPAARAAIAFADNAAARGISKVETLLQSATSPDVISSLTAVLAGMEKERGKINNPKTNS